MSRPGEDASQEKAVQVIHDRLASLGTLVASVAHEVNNPITYVLGNLAELERVTQAMRAALQSYRAGVSERSTEDLKLDALGGPEVIEELFADTYEGALRIRDLVRDLLNLSRPTERSSALVSVHQILDSTLRLANRQLASAATVERDYSACNWVRGDRAQLGGVFLNLITNAVDACQPPDPERHRIKVSTRDLAEGVEVEIADSGTGIPQQHRERVFSPFFTTKEAGKGTGLGLYISRRIVSELGGELDFRASPSRGTIFSVHLPGQGDE